MKNSHFKETMLEVDRENFSCGHNKIGELVQNKMFLYQFAISEMYRGQGLLTNMLKTINDLPIVALCPTNSNFNEYYYKSSWQ
ncbi:hypothetical protein ACM26V_03105 [Salipaludibacillus sp. HK11]|uniref:hypothetical protein n=1 Tax=Salipaludibacillus sp. HK11 TaxID=3394320 RepID=UPI0039FC5249